MSQDKMSVRTKCLLVILFYQKISWKYFEWRRMKNAYIQNICFCTVCTHTKSFWQKTAQFAPSSVTNFLLHSIQNFLTVHQLNKTQLPNPNITKTNTNITKKNSNTLFLWQNFPCIWWRGFSPLCIRCLTTNN